MGFSSTTASFKVLSPTSRLLRGVLEKSLVQIPVSSQLGSKWALGVPASRAVPPRLGLPGIPPASHWHPTGVPLASHWRPTSIPLASHRHPAGIPQASHWRPKLTDERNVTGEGLDSSPQAGICLPGDAVEKRGVLARVAGEHQAEDNLQAGKRAPSDSARISSAPRMGSIPCASEKDISSRAGRVFKSLRPITSLAFLSRALTVGSVTAVTL